MQPRPIHDMEAKWQKAWQEEEVYKAQPGQTLKEGSDKFYGLIEFPYPSGDGLHVGHPRSYTAIDIVTRKQRMEGKNVLYPIGWDAFGLPTENYAIKNKVKPVDATAKNVGNFTRQIKSLGFGFDWSREINTTDPAYFKWTQWQFLQFFKYGMAYKASSTINWCPKDKIGLANEEAQGGVCERCGTEVEKREKEQWMIRITDYAQRLLTDLDKVDYLDKIKSQQVNWIGKSEGAEIVFRIPKFERVLVATNNKSKLARVKKLLGATLPGLEVLSPADLGLEEQEVKEGDDMRENARAKAAAYAQMTDLPILGMDTGLFIAGEKLNVATPKRNALGGRDEASMTQEEKAEAMDVFYRAIAQKHGGEVAGHWLDVTALRLPDGTEEMAENKRQIVLTTERKGEMDIYFPVRGLYRVAANNKYVIDQTEEESIHVELGPLTRALTELCSYELKVFTTRPDTIFGVTYVTLAPEHPLVSSIGHRVSGIENSEWKNVREYIEAVSKKSEEERMGQGEKTGVRLPGVFAINPVNGERVPVWISDDVLVGYGTGAVMAVPAHDERDYAFAKTFGLPIRPVVQGPSVVERSPMEAAGASAGAYGHLGVDIVHECWTGEGQAINSGFLNGAPTWKAKEDAISWLEERGSGKGVSTYRLRDWVFSRQRYWGEPIPLVHCEACAKKKQKALIIHGLGSTSESNWYPALKQSLEKAGFEVFAPNLPSPFAPVYEEWMSVLKPYLDQLGESDVIVGHSLGGLMAVHAVAEMKRKIGHVHLVAPLIGPISDQQWMEKQIDRPDRDFAQVRKIWERPIAWGEASALIGAAHVLFSEDDTRVPRPSHTAYPGGWYLKSLGMQGHFSGADHPEIIREVLTSKNTGWIPVPENQLPLKLPEVEAYEPTDTGESPLAKIRDWVETTCPKCGGPATRETDTMPNWAGSSWYFLRYCDPHNDTQLASPEALKYWMPVDLYNGGMEHTTLHLLYSRFWHKFLWDVGIVPEECGSEPYRMRRSHNMILGEGGVKMSKSKGNVVNPDDVVAKYGADVFRLYEMFIGPYDQPAPWDTNGIEGMKRFLDKVWGLFGDDATRNTQHATSELETLYHQTVKKVSEGIENLQFNTSVSQLMILTNAFQDLGGVPVGMAEGYLKLLAPFAPHIAEEIWRTQLGKTSSIHARGAVWPTYDPAKLQASTFELVIQVNGKVRHKMNVSSEISEEDIRTLVLPLEPVQRWTEGKTPTQFRYVKGRLVNIVI